STPEIYTLSLHDALPIYGHREGGPGGQRALPRLRPGAPGRARERDQRRRGAHDRRPVDLGLRRDVLAGRRAVDAAPQHHGRGGRRDGLRPAHRGARRRGHGRDRVRRRRLPRDRDVPPPRGGLRRSAMLRSMLGSTVASERRPRTRAVYRELLADLETPLTAYLKVAGHPSFLLESVEQGEHVARYSFIGTGERRRVSARGREVTITSGGETRTVTADDPLRVLWDEVVRETVPAPDLPPLWAGAVGYASYDLVRVYERLPDANPDELGVPDLLFVEPELVVVFDHLKRRMLIVAPAIDGDAADEARARALVDEAHARLRGPLPGVPGDRAGRAVEFTTNMDQAAFEAAVAKAVEDIRAGGCCQVVPSLRQSADVGVHPFAAYRALRTVHPSPYLGCLDLGQVTLVSSSPESLVRAQGRHVQTRPIAGTRRRGATPEEDEALARELRADEKERAEHVMLVDLGRNDLGRVCRPGTVKVTDLMRVERYSHVMHLVSTVEGELAEGKTALD